MICSKSTIKAASTPRVTAKSNVLRSEFCSCTAVLGATQNRPPTLYFACHGKIIPSDRALRISDRLLRRDARDYGHPFPPCGHPTSRWRTGSARPPGPQGRHSLWHPWRHHRQPDRLLGGPQRGTTFHLEVGTLCEAHPGALGASRTTLRAPRRQGRLRGPFLLDLPRSRSAGSGYKPHAVGHVFLLQRPRRGGVGYGGCLAWVLLRSKLDLGASLVRSRSPLASSPTRGGAGLLPRLPVGGHPQG